MNALAKVAVLALTGSTALGAAGCNRSGGSGGTTTIIQQSGGGNAGSPSPSSTPAPVSIAPIDDPRELCHQLFTKTRGLSTALTAFWNIATGDGWTYTDPKTQDAVSRVEKESDRDFPALDGIVGKNVSPEIADAANEYLKKIKAFTNVVVQQQENEALNSASSNYGHAKEKLTTACNSVG